MLYVVFSRSGCRANPLRISKNVIAKRNGSAMPKSGSGLSSLGNNIVRKVVASGGEWLRVAGNGGIWHDTLADRWYYNRRVPDESIPKPDFTRSSDGNSICLLCFLTVKIWKAETVEEAENQHRVLCPIMPRPRLP